jgi:hypothetical protein
MLVHVAMSNIFETVGNGLTRPLTIRCACVRYVGPCQTSPVSRSPWP